MADVSDLPTHAEIDAICEAVLDVLALRDTSVASLLAASPPKLLDELPELPELPELENLLSHMVPEDTAFLLAQAERSMSRVLVRDVGASSTDLADDWKGGKLHFIHVTLSEPLVDRIRSRVFVWLLTAEPFQYNGRGPIVSSRGKYLVALHRTNGQWERLPLGSGLIAVLEKSSSYDSCIPWPDHGYPWDKGD